MTTAAHPLWCNEDQCEPGWHVGQPLGCVNGDSDHVATRIQLMALDEEPYRIEVGLTLVSTDFDETCRAILSPVEARYIAAMLTRAATLAAPRC